MKLHPNVTLAPGVTVPEMAWALHGDLLTNGIPRHRVTVRRFPPEPTGLPGLEISVSPLDMPEPLRFRES